MSVQTKHGHPLPTLLIYTLTPISLAVIAQPLLPVILPVILPSHILAHLPIPTPHAFPALQACLGFSLLAFIGAVTVIPAVSQSLADRGLSGRDLLKAGGRVSGPIIPECLGLPIACLYILLMMLFIPFPFSHMFTQSTKAGNASVGRETFPTGELTLYLSSLLSLLVAAMLGFIDDLFDIRWRHKLPIPLIAAIPTLMVYYSEGGLTSVVLPKGVGRWIESIGWGGWVGSKVIDLGPIYYMWLLLLPTFTTNSINILAGVNGVECIQPLIIACSVLLNDLLFLPIWPKWLLSILGTGSGDLESGKILGFAGEEMARRHLMSVYFMGPLVGVCAGFLWHNWYPARAFPGDTFCYFTGMAFSAVALQGHFSKTLILFFIPQIFNFILSCPQLFHFVECPRHRVPSYNAETNLLSPSRVLFPTPPKIHTKAVLIILETLGLVRIERQTAAATSVNPSNDSSSPIRNGEIISCTNLTILNFLLVRLGPMREDRLCMVLGGVQVGCSALAFWVRYGLGAWVYGGDRR